MWAPLEYGPFLVFANCVKFCLHIAFSLIFKVWKEVPTMVVERNFGNCLNFAHKLF